MWCVAPGRVARRRKVDDVHVLVTGGAGFIGANTTAALLGVGHRVTVVDDLSTGHRDAVPAAADLVVGDIRDAAVVDPVLADGVDACIHFAALTEAGASMQRPEDFFAMNSAGTLTFLQRLLGAGVERFVLSSTAAVYGEVESCPIREEASCRPTNPYGESKLLVERALDWLHDLRGLRVGVLRYFNAAGALPGRGERHEPESHLIPQVLQVAAGQRGAVRVFGTDYPTRDGTPVRDYVHVGDLVNAHVATVERLATRSRIVCNLGSGRGASVREIIDVARQVTGHPIPVVEETRRAGDPAVLVASGARARDLLDWTPARSDLGRIVADAWQWTSR